MEQGQTVTFYTHTGSDGVNDTQDEVAIVLRESQGNYDLVVFPVGGPVRFVSLTREFDPDDPYLVDGASYVREQGSDAPDFSERFKYSGDPEYANALNRIRKERDEAPGNKREETKERHKREMADVVKRLDEKHKPEQETPPEPRPAETTHTGTAGHRGPSRPVTSPQDESEGNPNAGARRGV